MTRRKLAEPRSGREAAQPQVPDPLTVGTDLSELMEPYDLPFPDDWWPRGRPEYVVVVAQLRGWRPDQQPSLAEALETGHASTPVPERDLEAEP